MVTHCSEPTIIVSRCHKHKCSIQISILNLVVTDRRLYTDDRTAHPLYKSTNSDPSYQSASCSSHHSFRVLILHISFSYVDKLQLSQSHDIFDIAMFICIISSTSFIFFYHFCCTLYILLFIYKTGQQFFYVTLLHNKAYWCYSLFALLGLHFLDIELKLLSLKNVPVTSATLCWS